MEYIGGHHHGSRDLALASGRADTDHHLTGPFLALGGNMVARDMGFTAVVESDTAALEEVSSASAVSWAAIVGGAVAAVAVTTILLLVGTGIGLTIISPWYGVGASATTVGVTAIIALVVVQWLSSAIGGYLAGRLRTKWVGVHTHEVFFRDTAHGFLTWCLASVAGALLLTSITASGVSGAARGAAAVASAGVSGAAAAGAQQSGNDASGYFVDALFRSPNPAAADNADSRGQALRILMRSFQGDQVMLSPDDKAYLSQLVAARAGITKSEADQRVDAVLKQMADAEQKVREAADVARKRTAQLSIGLALSMIIGAFIASAAAAYGGSFRDEY
jgi:hypothetical protein